jgi:uncharacterized protein
LQIESFSLFWEFIIYGAFVGLILVFPKSRQLYKKAFDFSVLRKPQTYPLILTAFLTIFMANLIIFNRSLFSTFEFLTSSYSQTLLLDDFEIIMLICGILIIAPIFEELMFRVPLSIWRNKPVYFVAALLTSSSIFGIMHSDYPLFGFILGMGLGIAFKVSKSVLPSIIVHFLWNLFSLFYYNYI